MRNQFKVYLENRVFMEVTPSDEMYVFNYELLTCIPDKSSMKNSFSGTLIVEDFFVRNTKYAVVAIDLGVEYGSVIVSEASNSKWEFTTIYDPQFYTHPVSVNREFGFTTNSNGTFTFYTRGADRLTGSLQNLAYLVSEMTPSFVSENLHPFEKGDAVWRSFQDGIINSRQESASKNTPIIKRPDRFLIKDVIDGKKAGSVLNINC